MVRDIPAATATGLVVLGWRAGEDGLLLRARGQPDEVRLSCRCGRCHWIVREQFSAGGAYLHLTCHNCGNRTSFLFEGAPLPAR